jgi:hypothetical protein
LNGVFLVALALTAAAGCVAFSAPLLLQEVLAWQGGRAASVRVRPHTCTPSCETSPGPPLVAQDVQLAQPTLWSQHAMRVCELRVTANDGSRYLLPVPPTQLLRPGDRFAVREVTGRSVISNCTTGSEMVLPRRLVKESSPLGSLAGLPLVVVAPFALLFVFVGNLGRQVAHEISTFNAVAGTETTADIHELSTGSDEIVGSGLTWLLGAALVSCVVLLFANTAPWPKPRVLTSDGRLLGV